jgi:hypothetical protein
MCLAGQMPVADGQQLLANLSEGGGAAFDDGLRENVSWRNLRRALEAQRAWLVPSLLLASCT